MSGGHLPTRAQVPYVSLSAAEAERREEMGTHVIVEMLDTVAKKRRTVMLGDSVLLATREGWDASKRR